MAETAQQAAAMATLVARRAAAQEQVSGSLVTWLVRALASFTGWYSDAAVRALAQQAAPVAKSAQQAAADTASEYQRLVLQVLGAPAGSSRAVPLPRGGLRAADPVEVWSRPVVTYRYERSIGTDEDVALERAITRADAMARTDVVLGARHGDRDRLQSNSKVTGYRRVLRPELSTTGVCGLCVAASDRLYSTAELLPIHDRERCVVLPQIGEQADPGLTINAEDLQRLYEAAGSTSGADLKRVRVATIEHGELGPMLVPERRAAKAATAPGDRPARPRSATPTPDFTPDPVKQAEALRTSLAHMEARGDKALAKTIARMREKLAALKAATA